MLGLVRENKEMFPRYGKDISKLQWYFGPLLTTSRTLPVRPVSVLATLASYNMATIMAVSRSVFVALIAGILEKSGSMYTLLPELLLISSTIHIAIPVLEFFSTLSLFFQIRCKF